ALPLVPALRDRLLRSGLPRSVLPEGRVPRDPSRGRLGARGQLAAEPRDADPDRALLRGGRRAAALRSRAPPCSPHGQRVDRRRDLDPEGEVRLRGGNPAIVVYLDREAPAHAGGRERYRSPRLTIESRPLPARPAPGDLRVRMLLAGVCGTDMHLVRADPRTGYIVGSVPLDVGTAGRVLGHEGVGQICDVGEGVDRFAVGDVVTFESILTCRECVPCRRGLFNQCRRGRLV